MKHKTSTVPTKVMKFGMGSPLIGARLVDEQIRNSGYYYNNLIALINKSREAYRKERSARFPVYDTVEKVAKDLGMMHERIQEEIRQYKILNRTRKVPPDLKMKLKPIDEEHKIAVKALKLLRKQVQLDPDFAKWIREHNAESDEQKRELRSLCKCYWGTYNLIEASVLQSCKKSILDPKFRKGRGEGRIGVQIQGGMSVSDLKTSTQLQIDLPDAIQNNMRCSKCDGAGRVPNSHGGHSYTTIPPHEHNGLTRGEWRRASNTIMRIRVGSMPDRSPIWAEFPVIIHRPLPADARIMGAMVTRRRLGIYHKWAYELCIACESKKFDCAEPLPDQKGSSSINFGWRQMGNELRVVMVRNEDGGMEEIRLPASVSDRLRKCDDLRSIIDTQFNLAREELSVWMRSHPMPDWLLSSFASRKKSRSPQWKIVDHEPSEPVAKTSPKQAIHNLSLWKSPERLANVVCNWEGLRFGGDEAIFPSLWEWRKKWMHLEDWNMRNRRRAHNIRDDFYNRTAFRLTRTNKTLFIEDFEKKRVIERPEPEVETKGGGTAAKHRTWAAISILQNAIKQMGVKYHCAVRVVKTKNNTRRCSECGTLEKWYPAKEIVHTCSVCHKTWDQDENNTRNIRKREASGQVVPLVMPEDVSTKSSSCDEKVGGVIRTFGDARKDLNNLPKIQADL